jgi:predicted lipoprotein with Yx(FWY)xxD motif
MLRLALVLSAALVVASAAVAAPPHATIGVRTTSLGQVLVDAKGRTLYVLDRGACTGGCAAMWPPLLTSGKPGGPSGLGTKRRADGKLQVTFGGKLLHRYALDTKPGEVFGAAVAHWFALSPQGAKLHAAAPPPPPPTTSPDDGYGY